LKSVIINGSPRKRTTYRLANALEKGLSEAGSQVFNEHIINYSIQPCHGCSKNCLRETPGKCIQDDDMQHLLPLVAESDLLVLTTPVYLDGMTGLLKNFIDRLLPLFELSMVVRGGRVRHPIRKDVKRGKIALLATCGYPELVTFDPLIDHVKAICGNLGREYVGELLVSRFSVRSESMWDVVLGLVEQAGTQLVNDGRISEAFTSDIHSLISKKELAEIFHKS